MTGMQWLLLWAALCAALVFIWVFLMDEYRR